MVGAGQVNMTDYDPGMGTLGLERFTVPLVADGMPNKTPRKVGDVCVESYSDNVYVATGDYSERDWTLLSKPFNEGLCVGWDDFEGYHDTDTWTKGGAGSTITAYSAGRGGILSIATGATTNNEAYIGGTTAFLTTDPIGTRVSFRLNVKQLAATLVRMGIGTTALADAVSESSVYFEYDPTASEPLVAEDWSLCVDDAGTITAEDSGVTVPEDGYRWFDLLMLDGANVKFYIDGRLVGTKALPETAFSCRPIVYVKTQAEAAKWVALDYIGWAIRRDGKDPVA